MNRSSLWFVAMAVSAIRHGTGSRDAFKLVAEHGGRALLRRWHRRVGLNKAGWPHVPPATAA